MNAGRLWRSVTQDLNVGDVGDVSPTTRSSMWTKEGLGKPLPGQNLSIAPDA